MISFVSSQVSLHFSIRMQRQMWRLIPHRNHLFVCLLLKTKDSVMLFGFSRSSYHNQLQCIMLLLFMKVMQFIRKEARSRYRKFLLRFRWNLLKTLRFNVLFLFLNAWLKTVFQLHFSLKNKQKKECKSLLYRRTHKKNIIKKQCRTRFNQSEIKESTN